VRSGEVLELMQSSGERGDLMMEPKKMGPEGGESRVGARKYVFGVGGISVAGLVVWRGERLDRGETRRGGGCRLDVRLRKLVTMPNLKDPWRRTIVAKVQISQKTYVQNPFAV
jgi:hypothetical protein